MWAVLFAIGFPERRYELHVTDWVNYHHQNVDTALDNRPDAISVIEADHNMLPDETDPDKYLEDMASLYCGELHPQYSTEFSLSRNVVYFEMEVMLFYHPIREEFRPKLLPALISTK